MSKKSKTNFKLEQGSVYLEIEDISDCCFELWEEVDGTKKSSMVKVKIPIKTWKDIIKKWEESGGAK